MTTPARIIWREANKPDCGKRIQPATGPCYWCGLLCQGEGVRTKDVCGKTFTNHDSAACIDATHVCVPCTWTMTGKPPNTFRMWSVLYRGDRAPHHHEKAADCLRIAHTSIMGRNDLSAAVDVLLDPPADQWVLSLAESGKIHTLPFARINYGGKWSVVLEREVVSSSPDEFGKILHHAAALYAAGYYKDDIRTGAPSPAKLARFGIDQWRQHYSPIQPRRGGPLCSLALFLLRRDNADELRDRTEEGRRIDRLSRRIRDRDDAISKHRQNQSSRLVAKSKKLARDSSGDRRKLGPHGQQDGEEAADHTDEVRDRQLRLFDCS